VAAQVLEDQLGGLEEDKREQGLCDVLANVRAHLTAVPEHVRWAMNEVHSHGSFSEHTVQMLLGMLCELIRGAVHSLLRRCILAAFWAGAGIYPTPPTLLESRSGICPRRCAYADKS